MAGMEGIIRPFVGQQVAPIPIHQPGGRNVPPIRLAIGIVGGTTTFSYSGSSSLSNYMAAVHTERASPVFDMTTGDLTKE
jgi:hypothetical protein